MIYKTQYTLIQNLSYVCIKFHYLSDEKFKNHYAAFHILHGMCLLNYEKIKNKYSVTHVYSKSSNIILNLYFDTYIYVEHLGHHVGLCNLIIKFHI